MRRIDTLNKAANLFGAGKHGWQDTPPESATEFSAAWMNAVQEELASIIEASGMALDSLNNAQAVEAVMRLISMRSGNYSADTGAANAYVVALSPAITAYTASFTGLFKAAHTNTSACVINAGGGNVQLVDRSGGALTPGDIQAGSLILYAYVLADNKAYMLSASNSASSSLAAPLNPIKAPNLIDDSLTAPPGTTVVGEVYIPGPAPTGIWSGLAGHALYADDTTGTAFTDLLGRAVAIGDRFGLAMEHGAVAGSFTGKGTQVAQVTNATPGSYAYSYEVPLAGNMVLVSNGDPLRDNGHGYMYNGTTSAWVEIFLPGGGMVQSQADARYPIYVGDAAGTVDARTATVATPISALYDGMTVICDIPSPNATGTPTFDLTLGTTSTGAITVTDKDGGALLPGAMTGRCVFGYSLTVGKWLLINQSVPADGHGQCRLVVSGANLVLQPFNGNKLVIAGRVQQIPAAGITVTPGSLPASAAGFTVNSLAAAAGVYTIGTAAAHNLTTGDVGWMELNTAPAGTPRLGFNYIVTSTPSGTSFTFTFGSATVASGAATGSGGPLLYHYAYMNAGVMAIESVAIGHETDATTGNEIKLGNSSRTLVGMSIGSSFVDTEATEFVRSWFNRRALRGSRRPQANRSTSSTTTVETNVADRLKFLSFADEKITMGLQATISVSLNPSTPVVWMGVDGGTPTGVSISPPGAGWIFVVGISPREVLSGGADGFHFASMHYQISTGSITWYTHNGLFIS